MFAKKTQEYKLRYYAVYDKIADRFLPPILYEKDNEAVRAFQLAIRGPSSDISQSPADYDMYILGSWDMKTGQLSLTPDMKVLVKGSSIKEMMELENG